MPLVYLFYVRALWNFRFFLKIFRMCLERLGLLGHAVAVHALPFQAAPDFPAAVRQAPLFDPEGSRRRH